jgi:hypothetical protein
MENTRVEFNAHNGYFRADPLAYGIHVIICWGIHPSIALSLRSVGSNRSTGVCFGKDSIGSVRPSSENRGNHGIQLWWYPEGALSCIRSYSRGQRHGIWWVEDY